MVEKLSPAHSLLGVDFQGPEEEIIGFLGDGGPIQGKFLVRTEIFLSLYFLQSLPDSNGIIQQDSEHHLEEDHTNGPDISLSSKMLTLRPYEFLASTSGAMVVTVPRVVPATSCSSF